MNNSFINLMSIQFKEFYREPSVLFWGFAMPILMIVVLGLAFMNKPTEKRTIAVIGPSTKYDAEFVDKLDSLSNGGTIHFEIMSREKALLSMQRGQIAVYIDSGNNGKPEFNYDPDNNEARITYLLAANALLSNGNNGFDNKHITAKGHRYIDFLVPGLLAMGIMNSCLWGIGWNLIDYRIKKLMRRMIATPVKRSIFLFAQIISRATLLVLEAIIIFSFAHWSFEVEVQGNVSALIAVMISGMVAFSGLSVLIASRASHSQVGNGLINATTMPMIILSGVFFSYENFPEWAAAIVRFLPLTLLADGIRAVFNEGANFMHVWTEILLLNIMGVAFFASGLKIFKWR